MKVKSLFVAAVAAVVGLVAAPVARAEVSQITIADQFGIAYLPLMVMQNHKLLEKHAQAAGLGAVKVNWARFGGAGMMNDALLSGSVDIGIAGVPALILLWDKTRTNYDVRGIAAINSTPMYLNTRNPNIKSLKDFTEKDKIALPSIKVSIQAITLQMAAAKEFGEANFAKLDPLTVTMSHPDATIALLSGAGEISAHFTSPPYMYQQLQKPGVRRVLSSKDVLGESTFIIAYATSKFQKENPKTYAAFMRALEESMTWIKSDKQAAAKVYLTMTKGKDADLPGLVEMLNDPDMVFEPTPKGIMKYAEFMHKVGSLKTKPGSWKDFFFTNTHNLPGS